MWKFRDFYKTNQLFMPLAVGVWGVKFCSISMYTPPKLTWNLKRMVSQVRNLQTSRVHFQVNHVSFSGEYLGVSKNRGIPKWMVYNGKLIKMDDLGVPLFSDTPISKTLEVTWSWSWHHKPCRAPHPDLQVALAYDFGNAGRAPPSWLGVYGSYCRCWCTASDHFFGSKT